jgi:hypothetical protein
MKKKHFIVTENHIKLLKAACVWWDDAMYGAPGIYPKAPYGDSLLFPADIAKIIGLKIPDEVADGEKPLGKKQTKLCKKLHREMEDVLQILLSNCGIEVGKYECDEYGKDWKRVKD